MSAEAPRKIVLKVKRPDAPVQPSLPGGAGGAAPAPAAPTGAVVERKPSLSFKLKVKAPPSAAAATAAAGPAPLQQQPSLPKRPAGEAQPSQQAPKKIKLVTGPKPAGNAAAGTGPPKPIIRLKTASLPLPPKQPRNDGPGNGGAAAGGGPAPLPVVKLTVPAGVGAAAAGRGRKPAKSAAGIGGPGKKAGAGAKASGAGRGKPGRKAGKQAVQLLLPEEEEDEDEDDLLEGPVMPRAPSARHAAVAATAAISEGPATSGGSRSFVLEDDDDEDGLFGEEGDDDVAFTEAPQAMPSTSQQQEQQAQEEGAPAGRAAHALPLLPPLPEGGGPAKREDLERVVRLVQKKDHHNIFKEPVTDEVAPGYSTIIKEPMDFTTIKGKLEGGEYVTHEDLQRDLRVMFFNAMTYNPPDSPFYAHARNLLGQAEKLMEQARQGVLSQRQAAGEARKQNAQLRAAERAQRDALRAAARAEQKAAQEAKVLKRAGVGDHLEESLDESVRNSYRRPLTDAMQARWRALGAGASAEGAAFGWGRQLLRPSTSTLPLGGYAASLSRFATGLAGKARLLVSTRAAAVTPNPDAAAADRLLSEQLARQPVAPTQVSAPAANPASFLNPLPTMQAINPAFLQQHQAALLHMQQQQQQQQNIARGPVRQQPGQPGGATVGAAVARPLAVGNTAVQEQQQRAHAQAQHAALLMQGLAPAQAALLGQQPVLGGQHQQLQVVGAGPTPVAAWPAASLAAMQLSGQQQLQRPAQGFAAGPRAPTVVMAQQPLLATSLPSMVLLPQQQQQQQQQQR